VNEPDNLHQLPLHLACKMGNFEIVRLICSKSCLDWKKISPNNDFFCEVSLMHCVVIGGNMDILYYLLG
jgi:ankyrin repeat protein